MLINKKNFRSCETLAEPSQLQSIVAADVLSLRFEALTFVANFFPWTLHQTTIAGSTGTKALQWQQDGGAPQGSCASGVDARRLQRLSISYDMDSDDQGL